MELKWRMFLLLAILWHLCATTSSTKDVAAPKPSLTNDLDEEEGGTDSDSEDEETLQWTVSRLQSLQTAVGLNGSVTGDKLCAYHEYYALWANDSVRPQFVHFQQKKSMLDELLKKFSNAHSALLAMDSTHIEQMLQQEVDNRISGINRAHNLVIACKAMLYDLFQPGWPGSYLDLLTFRAINSKSLDMLLFNSMLNRHKSLRQKLVDKAAQPLKGLIIEGAGPVGLFTAFEMFFAGMDVTIVNERTDYLRSHRIDTTNKMFFQTRYLLGSAHFVLFGEVTNDQILNGKMPQLSNKNLEKHLLKALQHLAAVAKHSSDGAVNDKLPYLSIGMGTRFEGITTGVEQDTGEFEHLAILQLPDGKMVKQPMDVLLCAGGANDAIRDALLGKPQALSHPVYYGKAIFMKDQSNEGIFTESFYQSVIPMSDLRPFLEKYKFFDFIKSHPLAPHIFAYAQLEKFEEKFWHGIKEHRGDHEYTKKRLFIIAVEDTEALVIVAETPTALTELIEILARHKQEAKAREFRYAIERRWFAILLEFMYWKHEGLRENYLPKHIEMEQKASASPQHGWLTFDPEPMNNTIFQYTLKVLPQPVRIIHQQGHPLVVAAIGDALFTPHFLTGIGISIGKFEADNIANILKWYHGGKLDLNHLAGNFEKMLKTAIVMGTKGIDQFVAIDLPAMQRIVRMRVFMPNTSASSTASSSQTRGKETAAAETSTGLNTGLTGQSSAGINPAVVSHRFGHYTSGSSIQQGAVSSGTQSDHIRPNSEQSSGNVHTVPKIDDTGAGSSASIPQSQEHRGNVHHIATVLHRPAHIYHDDQPVTDETQSGSIRQIVTGSIGPAHQLLGNQADLVGQKRKHSTITEDHNISSPKRRHLLNVVSEVSDSPPQLAATQPNMSQLQMLPSLPFGHHSESIALQKSEEIRSSMRHEADKKGKDEGGSKSGSQT